ncbi:LAMI_0H11078g1_1 [Lachancea mirantina]|uniref:LAMI_0H11078g1_1 n=1 Tax=Lachancea mirantina TaxID=1230905 RepID=A0A1G4KH29_9SACH|nr:LAMI_0H11078g1_1 [Lachancea mirantina]
MVRKKARISNKDHNANFNLNFVLILKKLACDVTALRVPFDDRFELERLRKQFAMLLNYDASGGSLLIDRGIIVPQDFSESNLPLLLQNKINELGSFYFQKFSIMASSNTDAMIFQVFRRSLDEFDSAATRLSGFCVFLDEYQHRGVCNPRDTSLTQGLKTQFLNLVALRKPDLFRLVLDAAINYSRYDVNATTVGGVSTALLERLVQATRFTPLIIDNVVMSSEEIYLGNVRHYVENMSVMAHNANCIEDLKNLIFKESRIAFAISNDSICKSRALLIDSLLLEKRLLAETLADLLADCGIQSENLVCLEALYLIASARNKKELFSALLSKALQSLHKALVFDDTHLLLQFHAKTSTVFKDSGFKDLFNRSKNDVANWFCSSPKLLSSLAKWCERGFYGKNNRSNSSRFNNMTSFCQYIQFMDLHQSFTSIYLKRLIRRAFTNQPEFSKSLLAPSPTNLEHLFCEKLVKFPTTSASKLHNILTDLEFSSDFSQHLVPGFNAVILAKDTVESSRGYEEDDILKSLHPLKQQWEIANQYYQNQWQGRRKLDLNGNLTLLEIETPIKLSETLSLSFRANLLQAAILHAFNNCDALSISDLAETVGFPSNENCQSTLQPLLQTRILLRRDNTIRFNYEFKPDRSKIKEGILPIYSLSVRT